METKSSEQSHSAFLKNKILGNIVRAGKLHFLFHKKPTK
jgi:hypothetical protein